MRPGVFTQTFPVIFILFEIFPKKKISEEKKHVWKLWREMHQNLSVITLGGCRGVATVSDNLHF